MLSNYARCWPRVLAVPPLLVILALFGSGTPTGSVAQSGADPSAYLPSAEALAGVAGSGATVLPVQDSAPAAFAASLWGATARYEVTVPASRPPGVRLPQVEGMTRALTWEVSISVSLFASTQDRDAFAQDFTARLLGEHPNANERAVPLEEADYTARDFRFNAVDANGLRRGTLIRLAQEECAAVLIEVAGLPVTPQPSGLDAGRQEFIGRTGALLVAAVRGSPPPCA